MIRKIGTLCVLTCMTLLSVAVPAHETRAQTIVEKDPEKCSFINLAHLYARCANFNLQAVFEIQRLIAQSPQNKALLEATLKATKEMQVDFIEIAMSGYKFAGRTMTADTFKARMNGDLPHIKAAFEEMDERGRLASTGKRKPAKPNILDACSQGGLLAEARDNNKLEARRAALKRDAEKLARQGKSCVIP